MHKLQKYIFFAIVCVFVLQKKAYEGEPPYAGH